MSNQTIKWLRGLAELGGKGVVHNIDARCLGRIADDLEQLRAALTQFVAACETAPPTSLMIEIGMACTVAKRALSLPSEDAR